MQCISVEDSKGAWKERQLLVINVTDAMVKVISNRENHNFVLKFPERFQNFLACKYIKAK